jgi:hypothetical protein
MKGSVRSRWVGGQAHQRRPCSSCIRRRVKVRPTVAMGGSLDRPGPERQKSPSHRGMSGAPLRQCNQSRGRQTINRSESRLPPHDSHHSLLHEQTPTPFQHVPHIPRRPFPFSRPRSCSEVCSISHGPPPESSCRSKSRWRDDASSVRSPFFLSVFA